MAAQYQREDLLKAGREGFAILDDMYGRRPKISPPLPPTPTHFHHHHHHHHHHRGHQYEYYDQHQSYYVYRSPRVVTVIKEPAVIDSYQAAQLYGGTMTIEYDYVKTPVKIAKQRKGAKKGMTTKSYKMRTTNSKEAEQRTKQENKIEEEVGVTIKWNLEKELTKVIENGVALGVNFNSEKYTELSGEIGQWNLEEEVAKVIETGKALGFDFNSREEEVTVFVARREEEDDDRSRIHEV
ncbi:hypothetical protein LWI28_015283 [Acer negundo]|uniref:Uncharacterized protein n=1 Tax=Acer negundo TaxID=4023 RepID=A0AAD5P226_ACENE|nr:hypothetical protein LWI28_015283 [Acer negundo]